MKFALLCKRHYTNKDLLNDRFGRLYHLPAQLGVRGYEGLVLAVDYRGGVASRISSPGVTFESMPLRPLTPLSLFWRLWRRVRSFRPDLVLASGDGYLGALGLHFARRMDVPFVFDIYDDYRVFRSARIPGAARLFSRAVNGADLLVYASAEFRAKLTAGDRNVCLVENGVDPELFRPMDKVGARDELGLNRSDTIVGFFGSMAAKRGVETLVSAAQLLRREIPGLRLLLAGQNDLNLDISRPEIDYRGNLPQGRIPTLINACDVVVIPYHPDPQVSVSNACKIAEYLACEVPIVATRVSNHDEILTPMRQGLCRPQDVEDLARAIRQQLRAPELVAFDKRLTWESLGKHLSERLSQLGKR